MAMAAMFSSSLLPIKPETFLLDRPRHANNYYSPFIVVNIPMTTARGGRRVFTSNCISNHTTSRDPAKLKSSSSAASVENVDVLSQLPPDEPRSGVLILVEALQREGVTDVFTNQNQTIPLKALSSASSSITTHSFLTHYNEFFAAKGYAVATGLPGVCMTSWIPGLTNDFIHGIQHAYDTQIPLVIMVVDGWEKEKEKNGSSTTSKDYGRRLDEMIKFRFRITSAKDIPTIIRDALFLARSGRPGPVLIDRICYDSMRKSDTPVWDVREQEELRICPPPPPLLPPREPTIAQLEKVIGLLRESKRPLVCAGSGCFEWRNELTRFVELTGIPVVRALKGVHFWFPYEDSFAEIDCCGSVDCCNFASNHFDLLLILDTNSSYYDRVQILSSCKAKVVEFYIGEDEEEEKEKEKETQSGRTYDVRCGDMKSALERLNHLVEEGNVSTDLDFSAWRKEMNEKRQPPPAGDKLIGAGEEEFSDYVVGVVNEITDRRDVFLLTSCFPYRVRFWDWSFHGPLFQCDYYQNEIKKEPMEVTLPVAAGAAIGKGRRTSTLEEITIVHIEDDKSMIKNMEELVVLKRENLPVKVVIFNHQTLSEKDPPDFASIAGSFGVPSSTITKKEDVRDAMRVMMETPGPYVLDIIISFSCAPNSLVRENPRTLEDDKKIDDFMRDLSNEEDKNSDDDEDDDGEDDDKDDDGDDDDDDDGDDDDDDDDEDGDEDDEDEDDEEDDDEDDVKDGDDRNLQLTMKISLRGLFSIKYK